MTGTRIGRWIRLRRIERGAGLGRAWADDRRAASQTIMARQARRIAPRQDPGLRIARSFGMGSGDPLRRERA